MQAVLAYRDVVDRLPMQEDPQVFGMHENANITFQLQDSEKIINTVLTMQPRSSGASGDGKSSDEVILELISELQEEMPENLYRQDGKKELFETNEKGLMASLSTVLLQEMEKFNRLLNVMRSFLQNLKLAIAGEIVMSAELDITYQAMINNQVPPHWSKVGFLSLKPLASWISDLKERTKSVRDWLSTGEPNSFWMSGLFFPQGTPKNVFYYLFFISK